MVTPTKTRSGGHGKAGTNGTGPVDPDLQEKVEEAVQDAGDPTITEPVAEDAAPNREERRKQERQEAADEAAARWAECEDAAREDLSIRTDLLNEAKKLYHEAMERKRVAAAAKGGFADTKMGFWQAVGFLKTTAGFGTGEYANFEARETAARIAEIELVMAQRDVEDALRILKEAARAHRIAKHMSARFRYRYYNESHQGYYRAAARVDMWDMLLNPIRALGYFACGVIATAWFGVKAVAQAVGVVAVGALALVAQTVGLVVFGLGQLFRWGPAS